MTKEGCKRIGGSSAKAAIGKEVAKLRGECWSLRLRWRLRLEVESDCEAKGKFWTEASSCVEAQY